MRANDQNPLNLLGEQAKDTTSTSANRARLKAFLRGLPSLDLSEKGRINTCRRFSVSAHELDAAVAALRCPRPSAPTAELLYTIGMAIGTASPTNKAKGGGTGRC